MKNKIGILILIFLAALIIIFFYTDNDLKLRRIKIDDYSRVDTIEVNAEHNIDVVSLVKYKALGKAEHITAIIKHRANGSSLAYKINDHKKGIRFSREYIALTTDFGKLNYGWFYVYKGKIEQLPGMKRILDSLKSESEKGTFIIESNGYITIKTQNLPSYTINYGHIVTKDKNLIFDSLPYALYRVQADSFMKLKTTIINFPKNNDGLFYVPPPGINIKSLYSKSNIFSIIDSVAGLSSPPNRISVKEVN